MTVSNLHIEQLPLGPADNFIYLLGDKTTQKMVVIDPAWDVPAICDKAEELGYTITAIWLTHGHGDHIEGVPDLLARHNVPVYISLHESTQYRPKIDEINEIDDGTELTVGTLTFKCLHTPGHSPGGQCFLYENHLIAGDTVFIDGCGRCDLPGSDPQAMYRSIHQRVMTLPDDTILYPGHNYGPTPTDTLGNQKKTNRFMLAESEEAFVRVRMGG